MARARRGRGEGSIYRRKDGLWCAAVVQGHDASGKLRRRNVYGKTKHEAAAKLAELHRANAMGALDIPEQLTLREFLEDWLENTVRVTLRFSSYRQYRGIIRNHVMPHIGMVRLAKVTPTQLQAIYASAATAGASARVRQLVHVVLHRALSHAAKRGLAARNVAEMVDKPRVPRRAITTLSLEQVRAFLAEAAPDRFYALYVLAISTGMRQGELFALRWTDIDLANGRLSVQHTLTNVDGKLELTEPKTRHGRRQVDLPQSAVRALQAHKRQTVPEVKLSPLVFCDREGGALRHSNFTRRNFKPLLKRAGLPNIRFHDLRHTAATLLLHQGVHPKVVQELLGHANIGITLDTYSHVMPSMQRDAVDKVDAALQGPNRVMA